MDATLAYLNAYVADKKPCDDWVYLNNFRRPHKPRPIRLPAGKGRLFRDDLAELVPAIADALRKAFTGDAYGEEVRAEQEHTKKELDQAYGELRQKAREEGLDVWQNQQGLSLVVLGEDGKPRSQEELMALPEDERARLEQAIERLNPAMAEMRATAQRAEIALARKVRDINRRIADETTGTLLSELESKYAAHPGLQRWLIELRADILDNIQLFQHPGEGGPDGAQDPLIRYAVNLLVDNGDTQHPNVVLEANPTYQNLFGSIEYRPVSGTLQTDFTMIRGGALHRANGGVLVVRAEAIAAAPDAWHFLKGALRDREIRIEELYRYGRVPMTGTPQPKPIPLDVKVVLVGAPIWYHRFLSLDNDFRTFFKIKADIDAEVDADGDAHDLGIFAKLIQKSAAKTGRVCDAGAIDWMMGYAARWASDRQKLSARFELIEDLVTEACIGCPEDAPITAEAIEHALDERRRRNNRPEDRSQEVIENGTVMIDTDGVQPGQINGLVYLEVGDNAFGLPSRITARASAGSYGVVNIERMVNMGGPIQQKGAMIVEGYLSGLFARRFPLSFSCSITFEQSYGGVEGDSASLAEVCAILSSLSGLPIRQDIAVTGSVNQSGQVQAIGGANKKIEGFYRTCSERGLTGRQGAMVPATNERNLTLKDDLVASVKAGEFHVWSAATVADAIELLTGRPAGEADADGNYPADSVFGLAMRQLEEFDRSLTERGALRMGPRS
jgi:predicted ATP-dependent protease